MSKSLETALRLVEQRADQLLAEAITIAEIPAPTFEEAERSAHIASRFREIGLQDVTTDELYNVTGRRPGPAGAPRVMVVAHMDTVHPKETDIKVRIEGDIAHGPGLRDNSTALSHLISMIPVLDEAGLELPCELILASSVGEEGMGDLRGVKKLIETWKDKVDAVLVCDGALGTVCWGGVGSRRLKVTYTTAGGHSFLEFGKPSALHGLATACARFADIEVPSEPKTTLNVGTFHGGSSVNTIASEATALIDMRSLDDGALVKLYEQAMAIFEGTAKEMNCTAKIELVGNRPGGQLPQDHPMVRHCSEALKAMGLTPRLLAASSDANIPLSQGITAVCIGLAKGSGVHTLQEYLEVSSLVPGLQTLIRVVAGLDWAAIR